MSILITVASLVSLVANLADDKVIVARENYLESDFNANIAVVDDLTITPIGRSNSFDGDAEDLTYSVRNKGVFTIDFYGPDALTNGNIFIARLNSQDAHEYTRDNDIEVFNNTTLTNIKKLQGKTTYNRYQVEITVKYTEEFTDAVLRIDTAEYTIITDN